MTDEQLRASILKASSPKPIRLEVAGLEQPIYIRKFSGYDGSVFAKQMEPYKPDDPLFSGRLLACLIVNEKGDSLFDVSKDEEVTGLAKLPKDVQFAIAEAHRANNVAKEEPAKP